MRIESVTAKGFGALKDQTLSFGPGLTVVCGRNESAKSTWHAAVYAAICGRPRRRGAATRSHQQFAARYRPWDGTTWQVEGRLLLDDGREVHVHHDLDGQVNCAATDVTTGRDLSAQVMYAGAPDASRWLGMNRDIFSAIACVRQADILSVLGSATALQNQLESAATHAGTSDETAAQAVALITAFLKENVGKDRANSTKPLRRAIETVERDHAALQQARRQHEQYLLLVRDAARLRQEVATSEADLAKAMSEATRLIQRWERAQELRTLQEQADAAEHRAHGLAGRLATAGRLRAQGADRQPESPEDSQTLPKVTRALTVWHSLPKVPELTGPDSATLRATLESLPETPEGDQQIDAHVADAWARLQVAQELNQQVQHEMPTVPELSSQGQAAVAVGAPTLRTWSAALDADDSASVMRQPLVIAAVVAALAGILLVVVGRPVFGAGLMVIGFLAALLRRPPADNSVRAQVADADLPLDAARLRKLAADVEHWENLHSRHEHWAAQALSAQQAFAAAQQRLADALAARGVSGSDAATAYTLYATACEQRVQQARMAARREVIAERLVARQAAEAARLRTLTLAREARTAVREAATVAGVDDDPAALQAWLAAQRAETADRRQLHDAWGQYQRAVADLSYEQLAEQTADAEGLAAGLRWRCEAMAADLGHVEPELPALAARARTTVADLESELANLRQRAALAEGKRLDRSGTLSSVAEAEERLEQSLRELARVRELEATLVATRGYLQQAQESVHRSIAPTLQATLLRWLPIVTQGRYGEAAVDPQTLHVRVKTGSGRWVEASQLSVGTAEQIYLLLRVALVVHLSDPGTSCPLLLDDVTVQADEGRTRALLDTLAQLADDRQVILFAQEPTVEKWARERPDVGLVALEPVPA